LHLAAERGGQRADKVPDVDVVLEDGTVDDDVSAELVVGARVLESILRNRFGRNLWIKHNLVKITFVIMAFMFKKYFWLKNT
jgi:uncharacterized membrane protein YczE